MLSGFWSSAPDLTPPGWIDYFIVVGLFGVGVLVVNCIVDASIVCSLCCVVCSVVCAWCACARGVLCVLI